MAPLPISDGRRFRCTACGNCCMQDGYVFVTAAEVARMAGHLGQSDAEFRRSYGVHEHPTEGELVLEAREGRGCPLLTSDRRCSVHEVKPMQCATWPFWSDMIEDETAWTGAKSYCPGLDAEAGRLYSWRQILEIARSRKGT